jgi:hypothetical protein
MKKTPAKKPKKAKRSRRPDFSQNALAAVEHVIGGKLSEPRAVNNQGFGN